MRSKKWGEGRLAGPSDRDGQMEAPLAASVSQHHPTGIRTDASHPGVERG